MKFCEPLYRLVQKRAKAYSLNYTILLFVLFTSMISSILIGNYYFSLRDNIRINHLETINNCQSGLNFLLAFRSDLSDGEFDTIVTINNRGDSVKLKSFNWGVFRIISSQANGKNYTINKVGIAGNNILTNSSPSLYLADMGRSLSLSQKTRINGKIVIPQIGLRYEMMNGINFTGDYVPENNISTSNDTLPCPTPYLDSLTVNSLLDLFFNESDFLSLYQSFGKDSIGNSFNNEALIIPIDNYELSGLSANGKILFVADSFVNISSHCYLEDVIVIGKEIRIEEGFAGSIQCFAKNRIIVEKNVKLDFPSSLVLIPGDTTIYNADYYNPEIICNENSFISGVVFSGYPYHNDIDFQSYLKIENGAHIKGAVYWPGKIQLQGIISGQTYTNSFYYKTALGTYRNYIVNGQIEQLAVSDRETFYIPNCLSSKDPGRIVKWLY